MPAALSEGALLTICQGGTYEGPVLQVLSYKKIAGSATDRYRLLVSDGLYTNSYAMLATQQNDLIYNEELSEFAIFRVNRHLCNTMQGKKVIVILELEVLATGSEVGEKIGNPVPMNADGSVNSENLPKHQQSTGMKRTSSEPKNEPPMKKPLQQNNKTTSRLLDSSSSAPLSSQSVGTVMPICSLNPYQNKWTIKARVTNKSDIRRWSNARGDGHLFSMDLMDESGEIRATGFKEQCDKFYNMIEVGKVYYISSCALKPANKQYSTIKNDFELTMRETTDIILCTDDSSDIPTITFDFCKIADLSASLKDQVVDVIGVCKSASDVVTINSQKLNKELKKRDVTIVDRSLAEINLTMWGGQAETFDPTGNPIIAIKGAKVSDYNGVSLSTLGSSVIQINPDMDICHKLKGWFEAEGSSASITSLTVMGGKGSGAGLDSGANLKTFADVRQENIGLNSDRPEYFSSIGTVAFIKKENALYRGCANEIDGRSCNKKVQDQTNGTFRCEKCNIEMERFNWRLILSLNLADMTDNLWTQCFQEQGEILLGMKADDLGDLLITDKEAYEKAFESALFKRFNFRFRAKAENYNDQNRVRSTVLSVSPIDWSDYCEKLTRELQEAGEPIPEKIYL